MESRRWEELKKSTRRPIAHAGLQPRSPLHAHAVFSPAKINLFLAVTGRRADGFHDLVSVVATLDFGDTLNIDLRPDDRGFELVCDDPRVPLDESNFVLRAAHAFRRATGWTGGARFVLEKRIPMGAGLGGGSSNAIAALKGLNALAGNPLGSPALAELAASLGSDCPLFLADGPVIMRGRGERLEPLPAGGAARLSGRRVLVAKPDFGISTVWAYRQMAEAAPAMYLPAGDAEARLAQWLDDRTKTAEQLLFNNLEQPAFAKFLALPVLLERVRGEFGVAAGMSGSGSACFALLNESTPTAALQGRIRTAWGDDAFEIEARIR